MIKFLASAMLALLLCSCYVSGYDPYYTSAPSSVYVMPSIYTRYNYAQSYQNYYSRPYVRYNYCYRSYTPAYSHYHLQNRH